MERAGVFVVVVVVVVVILQPEVQLKRIQSKRNSCLDIVSTVLITHPTSMYYILNTLYDSI